MEGCHAEGIAYCFCADISLGSCFVVQTGSRLLGTGEVRIVEFVAKCRVEFSGVDNFWLNHIGY